MPIPAHAQDAGGVVTNATQDTTAIAPPTRPRLRARDAAGILVRAVGRARSDHATNLAQAVAFNLFLAIPAAALVAVGVFATAGDAGLAHRLLSHLAGIVPGSVIALLDRSLMEVTHQSSGGAIMIAVGALLAVWSLTGAMKTLMWALNIAHDVPERRGFFRTRIAAVAMLACAGTAFVLVFALLVLGPPLSTWLGAALNQPTAVSWIWWTAQWPVLVAALLVAFGGVYRFGPDLDRPRWRAVTPGTLTALAVWLGVSGGFAWYVSNLGSYNKTWGSFAAVIVMLTWLWLSSLALLLGAEIDAEVERTRTRRFFESP